MDSSNGFVAIKFLRQAPQHENIAQRERDVLLMVQLAYMSQYVPQSGEIGFSQLSASVQSTEPGAGNCIDLAQGGHVIRLKHYFTYRGHVTLVFPLLGPSLSSVLRSNSGLVPPFPPDRARALFLSLCKGVAEVHSSGFVHTDIKPDNVLLRESSDSLHAVLIDLGSAVQITESCHHLICTRQYRPPEAILGLHWGRAADIWSLGCVAYEMHIGRLLFRTHDSWEHLALIERIIGPPPDLIVMQATAVGRQYYFVEDPQSPTGYHVRWPPPTDGSFVGEADSAPGKGVRDYTRVCQTMPLLADLTGLPQTLIQLIRSCLSWLPDQRPSINAVLSHPYLTHFDCGLHVPHSDVALAIQTERWNSPELSLSPSVLSSSPPQTATRGSLRHTYRIILTMIDVIVLTIKGLHSLQMYQSLTTMLSDALAEDNLTPYTGLSIEQIECRFAMVYTRVLPVYGFASVCQQLTDFDMSTREALISEIGKYWTVAFNGCPV